MPCHPPPLGTPSIGVRRTSGKPPVSRFGTRFRSRRITEIPSLTKKSYWQSTCSSALRTGAGLSDAGCPARRRLKTYGPPASSAGASNPRAGSTLNEEPRMSKVARVAGAILALGTAFIPFVASAQRAGDMTLGVMAGVNYATVEQDPEPTDIELDHRLGLLAGGFLDVRVNDVFSIEPEVL